MGVQGEPAFRKENILERPALESQLLEVVLPMTLAICFQPRFWDGVKG